MKKQILTPSLLTTGLALAAVTAWFTAPIPTSAQLVFSEDFDADHTANWTVNSSGGNNPVDFYFDYSTVGIPSAPHSSGGTTRGLKMQANVGVNVFSGVSVSPNGLNLAGDYEMHFDMWINFPKPNGSGNGTTQLTGAGAGTAGTSAVWQGGGDAVYFMVSSDGGSSTDYRAYAPGAILYGDASPVYAAGAVSGNRNNTHPYYSVFGGASAPAAQVALFPAQTGTTPTGTPGFAWRNVVLKKVANLITYTIDGTLIATVDASALSLGGDNILFNYADINTTSSTDVDSTNLLFGLIDNIRVTNLATVVNVSVPTPDAAEAGPVAGVFTLTRTAADVSSPLTVNFTLTGTAANGVDYTNAAGAALPTSVTIAANETSTNISIIPVDDTTPELAETVILTVTTGAGYAVGTASGTVTIADNDTPRLEILSLSTNIYERLDQDYAAVTVRRFGDVNVALVLDATNFACGGIAVSNVDYYLTNLPATIDVGAVDTRIRLLYPVDDTSLEGSEGINLTLLPGSGFTVANNTASTTITDDELPAETVLWSDNLHTDTSANWTILFGSADPTTLDYTASWMYDYSAEGIPPAPHSGGNTHGLKISINDVNGAAAGVNLYPNGQSFSGNYALRFDMYLQVGKTLFTTELALFGLNHDSAHTNWFQNTGVPAGWTFDGLWWWIEADAAAQYAGGDYRLSGPGSGTTPPLLAGRLATTLMDVFKSPPFGDYTTIPSAYGYPGVPANNDYSATPCWADVEVSQIGNVITLTVNRTPILSYTNNSYPTSGNIMLGYCDPANSIGPTASSVIFANARVVQLAAPASPVTISNIVGNTISYGGGAGSQFVLLQSASITAARNTWTRVATNVTTPGSFTIPAGALPPTPGTAFYCIQSE